MTILEQGANLALDRLLKTKTEEQILETPEPEQLAVKPKLLKKTGVTIPTEPLAPPVEPFTPPEEEAPPVEELPPEGEIDFPVELPLTHPETGESINAYIWEDYSVWVGGEKVGTVNPQTGEYQPLEVELPWYSRILKIAEYANLPFKKAGQQIALPQLLGQLTVKQAKVISEGMVQEGFDPTSDEDFNKYIARHPEALMEFFLGPVSGKLEEEYAALPWWQKALYETPGYIMAFQGIPTATRGLQALKGKTGIPATVGRALLKPIAAVEAAPAKLLSKIKPKVPPKPIVKPVVKPPVKPPVTKLPPGVQKFQDAIVGIDLKKAGRELKRLRAPQLGEKFAKLETALGEVKTQAEFNRAMGALKGQLKKAGITLPEFAQSEIDDIYRFIAQARVPITTRIHVKAAFDRMLIDKLQPTPSQVKALTELFGKDFTAALTKQGSKLPLVLDILNIPRSSLASADFSASLRQLIFEYVRHPTSFFRDLKFAVRVMRNPKNLDWWQRVKKIQDPEAFLAAREFKLDIPNLARKTTVIGERAEPFLSRLAEKVPWIRKSEEAFVAMIDKKMWDSWRYGYRQLVAQNATHYDFEQFARLISYSAGRGALPSFLRGNVQSILNMAMFSPKYVFARIRLPLMLFSESAYVRKEAAIRLFGLLGIGATILKLLDMSGVAEVEVDPRSADFGKIKIGQIRIDMWSGLQQYVRFFTQLATAQRKTPEGEIVDINRREVIDRLLQSKEAPGLAIINDLFRGRDYLGRELTLEPEDLKKQAFNRLVPIALQDIWEAYDEDQIAGALIAAPSILGIGVVTYETPEVREELLGQENEEGKLFTTGNLARDVEERLVRITPKDIERESDLIKSYVEVRDIIEEYGEVFGSKAKGFWLKENIQKVAQLYLWGEISENRLSILKIANEVVPIAEQLAKELGIPLEAIGDANAGWEREPVAEEEEKLTPEEKLYHYMDVAPMWLADYVWEHKEEWYNKDMDAEMQKLMAMDEADDKLIAKYNNLPADSALRVAFREDNPEVDVALNIWGRVTTIKSKEALELLKQRADELGIPYDVLPALAGEKPKVKEKIILKRK